MSQEEVSVLRKRNEAWGDCIRQLLEEVLKLKEENEGLRSYRRRKRGSESVNNNLGGRSQPLGEDRSMARHLVSGGNHYFRSLLLMAVFKTSLQRGQALTQEQGKNLRRALNREWGSQRGEEPPAVPDGWWRGEDLLILNDLARQNP